MPHITVKHFDTASLDSIIRSSDMFLFRACAEHGKSELLGVCYEGESFLLEIKKRAGDCLIKSDKVSRPLDINKVKKVLAYLAERAELEIVQSNIALSTTKPALAEAYDKKIREFENPEFTSKRVAIEVGFGSGRHLLFQAKENPDRLHIGIEIHTPSAQQVLKQIALQGIENIWIVNYDARLLLEMIPSNSCEAIYVHFPVPWDKKPHRRVIGLRFLEESLRVLAPQGELELRTDSENYYHYTLEVFRADPKVSFHVEKNSDLAVTSKYEERWRRQAKDIYTVTVHSTEISAPQKRDYSFGFPDTRPENKRVEELPVKAIVERDFFVHFERRYTMVTEEGYVIKCAFGSCDRPEHKYLCLRNNSVQYYPSDPVKTEANYHAHRQIGALLYG